MQLLEGHRELPGVLPATVSQRLDSGQHSCGYFLTWIEINRVSFGGTLRVHPDLARHIFAIGTGVMNPPNLWRPNERP